MAGVLPAVPQLRRLQGLGFRGGLSVVAVQWFWVFGAEGLRIKVMGFQDLKPALNPKP